MNQLFICMVCLAMAIFASSSALAGIAPGTGISLSKHDVNILKGATQDTQQRICAFCHTPHHSYDPSAYDYLPLWSHEITQQTFVPYQSITLSPETRGVVDPLVGPSRLCMSCHDGIIAADRHYATLEPGNRVLGNEGLGHGAIGSGGDLTNDHPIGFDYTKVAGGNGGSGTNKRIFAANATLAYKGNPSVLVKDQLFNGTIMTCCTCHDVHNKDNINSGGTLNYFVYAPQRDSQLCLTCHDK